MAATPVLRSLTWSLCANATAGFLGLIALILHAATKRRWMQIIGIGFAILAFISALAVSVASNNNQSSCSSGPAKLTKTGTLLF